jgi:hypothetical protein
MPSVFGTIKIMNDEDIAEVVVMWIWIIGILLVASLTGLIMGIVEGISKLF